MKYHLHYLIFSIIFLIFVVDIKITIPLNSAIDKEKLDSISTKQIKNKQNDKFNSKNYWENRYKTGGNSGAGSYSNLAEFKAEIINEFVRKNSVDLVVEWGSGDGNQLSLAKYKKYLGFDVSATAVNLCREKFKNDTTKNFVWSGEKGFKNTVKGDLSLSLDVIYHLIEDEVFNSYMKQLFDSSKKFVIIYSCNDVKLYNEKAVHVRCRKFTNWIEQNKKDWKLIQYIRNRFPYRKENEKHTSFSDFYIYEKINKKEEL